MPAQIKFLDVEPTNQIPPDGDKAPVPITLGPSWEPNDVRLIFNIYSNYNTSEFSPFFHYYWPTPLPPPGFTLGHDPVPEDAFGNGSHQPELAFWRRLQAGDVDNVAVSWIQRYWRWFGMLKVTARGVHPTTAPQFIDIGTTQLQTPSRVRFPSVTVPAEGIMLFIALAGEGSGQWSSEGNPNSQNVPVTGAALGVPAGWTHVAATEKSGKDYYQYDTATGMICIGKYYSGAGSTGTVDIPASYTSGAIVTGQVYTAGYACFLRPAPDATSMGAAGTTITLAGADGSASAGNSPTSVGSAGDPILVGGTNGANPLDGYWLSNPMLLPGDPVTASRVEWDSTGPGVTVETSINAGLSWERPRNGGAIPRLLEGDRSTRQILTRVTLHRDSTSVTAPKVHRLRVRATTDSGAYEWVPIGHGMIDKPKTKLTSGSSGGGSSSGVGGTGAASRSGGAFGGGQVITIHATDLSRSIKLAGWETPYVIPVQKNYVDAAIELCQNRLPWLTKVSAVPTSRVIEESALIYGLDQQQDPWQDCQELLASIGYECFFQPDGTLRIQPIPDPRYAEPVWTVKVSDRMMAEATRELSDEMIKNLVVVTGEASSSKNPISVAVQDDDPMSDTRVDGRLGKRVARARFPHITTEEQALAAAYGILYNSLSLADTITIKVPPIYVLEPGDAVRLEIPGVKAYGTYLVQRMDTPLGNGLQELTLFKQSVRADFELSA